MSRLNTNVGVTTRGVGTFSSSSGAVPQAPRFASSQRLQMVNPRNTGTIAPAVRPNIPLGRIPNQGSFTQVAALLSGVAGTLLSIDEGLRRNKMIADRAAEERTKERQDAYWGEIEKASINAELDFAKTGDPSTATALFENSEDYGLLDADRLAILQRRAINQQITYTKNNQRVAEASRLQEVSESLMVLQAEMVSPDHPLSISLAQATTKEAVELIENYAFETIRRDLGDAKYGALPEEDLEKKVFQFTAPLLQTLNQEAVRAMSADIERTRVEAHTEIQQEAISMLVGSEAITNEAVAETYASFVESSGVSSDPNDRRVQESYSKLIRSSLDLALSSETLTAGELNVLESRVLQSASMMSDGQVRVDFLNSTAQALAKKTKSLQDMNSWLTGGPGTTTSGTKSAFNQSSPAGILSRINTIPLSNRDDAYSHSIDVLREAYDRNELQSAESVQMFGLLDSMAWTDMSPDVKFTAGMFVTGMTGIVQNGFQPGGSKMDFEPMVSSAAEVLDGSQQFDDRVQAMSTIMGLTLVSGPGILKTYDLEPHQAYAIQQIWESHQGLRALAPGHRASMATEITGATAPAPPIEEILSQINLTPSEALDLYSAAVLDYNQISEISGSIDESKILRVNDSNRLINSKSLRKALGIRKGNDVILTSETAGKLKELLATGIARSEIDDEALSLGESISRDEWEKVIAAAQSEGWGFFRDGNRINAFYEPFPHSIARQGQPINEFMQNWFDSSDVGYLDQRLNVQKDMDIFDKNSDIILQSLAEIGVINEEAMDEGLTSLINAGRLRVFINQGDNPRNNVPFDPSDPNNSGYAFMYSFRRTEDQPWTTNFFTTSDGERVYLSAQEMQRQELSPDNTLTKKQIAQRRADELARATRGEISPAARTLREASLRRAEERARATARPDIVSPEVREGLREGFEQ